MIRHVEGFYKYVGVAGFEGVCIGDVDGLLSSVRERLGGVAVQFFDARFVAGWRHLYFAVLNALKAFEDGANISESLAVECLLYACAQRQIKAALEFVGIKRSSSEVAVMVVADEEEAAERALEKVSEFMPGKRNDMVLELSDEKVALVKELFGISEVELGARLGVSGVGEALCDLVVEHMALLVTQR